VAEHAGGSLLVGQEGGEDPDGGGLSGPVGAEQAVDDSRGDLEVEAVQGNGVAESLDDSVGFDGR